MVRARFRVFLSCLALGLAAAPLSWAGSTDRVEHTLHSFSGPDGANPSTARLIQDGDGNLYGGTGRGGRQGHGVVFELSPGGTETVLHDFTGQRDGQNIVALVRSPTGDLYGATGFGGGGECGVVFRISGDAFSILHTFRGGRDGCYPSGGMVLDDSGALYGATFGGGGFTGADCPQNGCGTLFRIDAGGGETVLHRFEGLSRHDGSSPGGVARDASGMIFGSTLFGGVAPARSQCSRGCGTLYQLAPSGDETVLYRFRSHEDGIYPSEIILDGAGIYGVVSTLGHHQWDGYGAIFEFTGGELKLLHHFKGGSRGAFPIGPLVRDEAGNLYGSTEWYGDPSQPYHQGAVFELRPNGHLSILHNFSGDDGGDPGYGVTRGAHGVIYGAASGGGPSSADCPYQDGCGTLFEISAHKPESPTSQDGVQSAQAPPR